MKKFLLTFAAAALAIGGMSAQTGPLYVAINGNFLCPNVTGANDQQIAWDASANAYVGSFDIATGKGFRFYTKSGDTVEWMNNENPTASGYTLSFKDLDSPYEIEGTCSTTLNSTSTNYSGWYVKDFPSGWANPAVLNVKLVPNGEVTFTLLNEEAKTEVSHTWFLRGTSTGSWIKYELAPSTTPNVLTYTLNVPKVTSPIDIGEADAPVAGYGISILDERVTTSAASSKSESVIIGVLVEQTEETVDPKTQPYYVYLTNESKTYTVKLAEGSPDGYNNSPLYLVNAGKYQFDFNTETYQLTVTLLEETQNSVNLVFDGVSYIDQLPNYVEVSTMEYNDEGDLVYVPITIEKLPYVYSYGTLGVINLKPVGGTVITASGEGMGTTWIPNAGAPDVGDPDEDAPVVNDYTIQIGEAANGTTITIHLSASVDFSFVGDESVLENISDYVSIDQYETPVDLTLENNKVNVPFNTTSTFTITPKKSNYAIVVDCINYTGLAGNKPYTITTDEATGAVTVAITAGANGLNFQVSVYNTEENINVTLNFIADNITMTPYRLVNVEAIPAANVAGALNVDSDNYTFACKPELSLIFSQAQEGYIVTNITTNQQGAVNIQENVATAVWTVTIQESAVEGLELNITVGEGEPAAVETIGADNETVIYNLQGVRVSGDNLPKGIYIVNGKKVVK